MLLEEVKSVTVDLKGEFENQSLKLANITTLYFHASPHERLIASTSCHLKMSNQIKIKKLILENNNAIGNIINKKREYFRKVYSYILVIETRLIYAYGKTKVCQLSLVITNKFLRTTETSLGYFLSNVHLMTKYCKKISPELCKFAALYMNFLRTSFEFEKVKSVLVDKKKVLWNRSFELCCARLNDGNIVVQSEWFLINCIKWNAEDLFSKEWTLT